jgi:hypothetical protein
MATYEKQCATFFDIRAVGFFLLLPFLLSFDGTLMGSNDVLGLVSWCSSPGL